uniref:Murine retrovirus integration site 1 homolog n=1 Tax=Oryzias sinensis TaxID=183150 RepID=A0A8C7Y1Y7_9TELE
MDSSSSSPRTSTPSECQTIVFAAPTIIYPQQITAEQADWHSLEQARPHSPRARLAKKPSGGPITTVDSTGNVIDLLRDQLPEPQLSEEDRQKNLELLEQAKKVSDRFLSRRGRRSTSSLTESPTALSPCPTPPSSSPSSSRSSSVIVAPQTGLFSIHISQTSKKQKQICFYKYSFLDSEHKLMRNQSIVASKLPELSEATEQEKGPLSSSKSASIEEGKENAMPNISDVMLRKLKLHRALPGCAPPLSEKEVENAFVQLSLAFRNDNYTLETRLKQAERERNLTEEETEKELEEFKGMTSTQWQNMEQRDAYQRLIETVCVLHRLANRLSSRAEIVGAVRQEKRMNKATEVMMQYVENLKRIYEKDHAELTEFKKLANQNSNRCYAGAVETGGKMIKMILSAETTEDEILTLKQ